jgi:threonylcarbamoyladenosine tRNA methylthiotransferase MtaB
VLRKLSYLKMQHFTELHTGQSRKVLFEGTAKNEMMEGYTDNYIRITAPYKKEWINQVVAWNL